jgi:hypothetical protein
MITKLYRALYKILPKQKIPKLPRGMYSAEYSSLTTDERRVLARLGARDPRGIKLAMKRAGVDNIEALIALLEHQKPRRDFEGRLERFLCALEGSEPRHPHQRAIRADARRAQRARQPQAREISQRLKIVTKAFEES